VWTFEHSVECNVDRDFAWQFWTNVSNWPLVDSSVESATLDGPFQSGAQGTTKPRGGEAVHWQLEHVHAGRSAVVVIHLSGAALRFAWRFEDRGVRSVRMTQRVNIEGERAQDYISTAAPELERGMPAGMRRLADAMEQLALGAALGRRFAFF
jgi:polyketide cyclase/dehydrase/lipid transport protein